MRQPSANPNRWKRTNELYRYEANRYLGDWLPRPRDAISRADVEARFNSITADHGWSAANRAMSLLRSIYRRPCVDHDGLRNPVDLWLAGGGKFHRKARRKISAPAEVLPCWRAGIEAEVNNPAIRDALWFGLYTGMRRDEVLTLRWERVDMDALTFRVEETKTGVPLELPITNQLAVILERRRTRRYRGSARRRPGMGVPVADQRDRPCPGPASSLRPHRQGRRRQVLVPRPAQQLHHRRRARADAAALAHQAAGQPRPAQRRDPGIRRRLDHRPTSRARAEHRRSDRGPHVAPERACGRSRRSSTARNFSTSLRRMNMAPRSPQSGCRSGYGISINGLVAAACGHAGAFRA